MHIIRVISLVIFSSILVGCVTDSVLTQEEVENQNKASEVVSGVLFEKDLDDSASYNIRKSGYVVILFDESVSSKRYTEVVHLLRSSPNIKGVRAEQNGAEVCGINPR